jgi:GNAT superfamily N-acetyltransferase
LAIGGSARHPVGVAVDPVIRPSTIEDADELGVVHIRAWQSAYRGLVPDDYLDRLSPERNAARRRRTFIEGSSPGTELVAQVDHRIAGFVTYGPPRDTVPDGWGELWVINLHPDFWRQGIGSRLFDAAVRGLRDLGYRRGYLWVLAGNDRGIGFYRDRGWHPDGELKTDHSFDPPLTEVRCSADLDAGRRI